MPRDSSPCGTVLDRNAAQLMSEPGRYYPDMRAVDPPVVEALLVPFYRGATPIGTVWVIAHTPQKRFEAEDARLVASLCQFASAAVLTVEQTRQFDRVLSSITDFAYTFDLDGRFTFINKPLLDLWGLTLDQAVGKNFFDLKYPDDLAAKLQEQIQQVIRTRRRLVDETPYTSPTGAGGYYQYIFSPVIGASGEVEAVAGSTRDITDYKRLEGEREGLVRTVEAERAKLAEVIEQRRVHLHAPRARPRLRAGQRAVLRDPRPARLLGKPIREAIPEGEGQGFFELLDNVYRTGEAFTGNEMPVLPRRHGGTRGENGGPLDAATSTSSTRRCRRGWADLGDLRPRRGRDRDGPLAGRAAEREGARTSEERLAFALDAAELGTFYCPMPPGEIVWNRTCKEHFWLPPDAEVNFDLFYSIIHPDDREPTRRAVEEAVYRQRPYDVEYRTVGPGGQVRWIRAKGRAYHDAAGNPTRFDGVTLDVTEQVRAEAAVRVARDEAESANRAKDKFLAVLSHELRTPLSPVVMTVPAMEMDPDLPSSSARTWRWSGGTSTWRSKLIDDLLDLSRVTSGKLRLQMQPSTPTTCCGTCSTAARRDGRASGCTSATTSGPPTTG